MSPPQLLVLKRREAPQDRRHGMGRVKRRGGKGQDGTQHSHLRKARDHENQPVIGALSLAKMTRLNQTALPSSVSH